MNSKLPPLFSLLLFCSLSPLIAAQDDYIQALEAEADELNEPAPDNPAREALQLLKQGAVLKMNKEIIITPQMQADFEARLRQKSGASFKTYRKLHPQNQRAVSQYYYQNGKNMEHITMKLFEQYSEQIKNER